jgi:hypothetical protein
VKIHRVFMSVNFKSILAFGLYYLPNLPTVNEDGTLKSAPSAVLEGRQIPRHTQEVVQRPTVAKFVSGRF